jgi:hypothetical protein
MRILVADRNGRLLESISRTFARQFSIQTATTCEQCNELLRDGLDLAIVSEKLADGPGLKLLAGIARNSPDTLRVFVARRPRLQLLQGKLGPFGLFRTLSYPINPRELLCVLTLARAGLEVDPPALEAREVAAPMRAKPVVERISFTSPDAAFATNVPKTIASLKRARRSNPRQARPAVQPNVASGPSHPAAAAPPRATGGSQPGAASTPAGSGSAASQPNAAPPPRPAPVLPQVMAAPRRREVAPPPPRRGPARTKLVLGATVAVVFLVTTLTLNLLDSSVHITHASAPAPVAQQPRPPEPPLPVAMTPAFTPTPHVAQRVEPKPDPEPGPQQVAASAAPAVADPSSFGSEAYEPIYSN